jgi:hypothetical protein
MARSKLLGYFNSLAEAREIRLLSRVWVSDRTRQSLYHPERFPGHGNWIIPKDCSDAWGKKKVNRGCRQQNFKNGWRLCLSNSKIERSSGAAGDPLENTGPSELEMPRIEI